MGQAAPKRLILVDGVGVRYRLRSPGSDRRSFWALRDVCAEVFQGESLGVVGRNSAGKSTLLRVLARIIAPDRGAVTQAPGLETALLSLQVGFIPQLTGRENAVLSGLLLGLSKREVEREMEWIVAFAELEEFIDQPMHSYSSGMRARLGFSVAFRLEPDVLLIDEVLSAGDWSFRKKSALEMRRKIRSEKTIVLVSHNPKMVRELCDRALWLDGGVVRESGETERVLRRYEAHLARRQEGGPPARSAILTTTGGRDPGVDKPASDGSSAEGGRARGNGSGLEGESPRRPGWLFVMGCERSGTTAFLRLLNSDRRIVLGRERFKFVADRVSPEHFEAERFFHPVPEETNYLDPGYYEALRERWRAGDVRYLGDKNPRYYEHLPRLAETFPGCRILFLVRDLYRVASSYNVRAARGEDRWPRRKDYRLAVRDWNRSLSLLRKFVLANGSRRVFVVEHAQFFSARAGHLARLYSFLGLPLEEPPREAFASLCREWQQLRRKKLELSPEMVEHLERKRDRLLEIWALQACPRL